jgi:hypothetical protein
MTRRTRICLYGDSIILAGVGASLALVPHFEVISRPVSERQSEALAELAPHVVLFDLGDGHPDAPFSLLEARPDLMLLGISPDGNVVRQWSGRQYCELSTEDLTALIEAGKSRGEGAESHRSS